MSKELHDELIFVGYTNGPQILYAADDTYGEQGAFFKTSEDNCIIPLYMLRTHEHRLSTTSSGEVDLYRVTEAQNK